MTQQPGRSGDTALPSVSTPAEARTLAENLMDVMSALLGVIERETELVRAGKLREAMAFEPKKTDLSRRYVNAVDLLQASQKYLAQTVPELLTTLHRHHDMFRAMLQINLTVLATAHAVSEGLIRSVNIEMQKKSKPQTYTATGQQTAPNPRRASPMSLNRSL
jgi:hypothetical protein